MYYPLIKNIFGFIGLFLLQVFVFDNISLGNYIHPIIYVLFILAMPFKTPKWSLLLCGFLMGISVDVFNGTPGLNAAATVLMAFLRPYIIGLMTRKGEINDKNKPSIDEMGAVWFLIYSLILLFFHNLLLFTLEAFSFKLFGVVILEVLLSVPVSAITILLISYLIKPYKKNL